ncbi:unnamed protein product, partial [Prorocentrum cordatum]
PRARRRPLREAGHGAGAGHAGAPRRPAGRESTPARPALRVAAPLGHPAREARDVAARGQGPRGGALQQQDRRADAEGRRHPAQPHLRRERGGRSRPLEGATRRPPGTPRRRGGAHRPDRGALPV